MTEAPPMKCPECDGAMIEKPKPRCVRCGPIKKEPITLAGLLGSGAKVQIDVIAHGAPPQHRGHAQQIYINGGTRNDGYNLCIGAAGALLQNPDWRIGADVLVPIDFAKSIDDKAYWSEVKAKLFELIPGRSDCGRLLWKRTKEKRLWEQRKEWDEVLPMLIVKWAVGVLDRESKGCDCVDNYRVARTSSSSQMRRYRGQKASGCCGSDDFKKRGPDLRMYILGYNYGH